MATSLTASRPSALDRSIVQGGFWERGSFTVPADVSEERVRLVADKYERRFARLLEFRGLTVHLIVAPQTPLNRLPRDEADRRRYVMMAWCSRRPVSFVHDIPDEHVPAMEKLGLRLVE